VQGHKHCPNGAAKLVLTNDMRNIIVNKFTLLLK